MITSIIEKLQLKRHRAVLQKHPEVLIGNILKAYISNYSILHLKTENFVLDKGITFKNYIRISAEIGGSVERRERKYTFPLQLFYGELNQYQLSDTEKN